jgi:hypothetical protein
MCGTIHSLTRKTSAWLIKIRVQPSGYGADVITPLLG